jgi:hypothetical protein
MISVAAVVPIIAGDYLLATTLWTIAERLPCTESWRAGSNRALS